MISKKALLKRCNLYLILDAEVCDYQRLWEVLKAGVNNGVDIVQLRDKLGSTKRAFEFVLKAQRFLKGKVPLIVNDRADLAVTSNASGVHVGQDDLPVAKARLICGSKAIVGKSCQNMQHVRQALMERADYIGFGSVFKTKTKPDRNPMDLKLLQEVATCSAIPVFAIGGVSVDNISLLRSLGVSRVAICRALLLSSDPGRSAKILKRALTR